MSTTLTVTPLTTSIGARVEGLDLLQPITPDHAGQIRAALDAHCVLHFPRQAIGLDEQNRLAEVFGPLQPLPSLGFLGVKHANVSIEPEMTAREAPTDWRHVDFQGWHTDSSFTSFIPRAAVLRAEVLSPVGGGTSWTNMCAAYDALSPSMQAWLGTLKAIHWYPPYYKDAIKFDTFTPQMQAAFDAEFPPREHPVVVQHPTSGRKLLFVNPGYTVNIVGLSDKESRTVLRFLFEHAATSDFVYRHRWVMDDIMVWDELATLHLAPQDYRPHPRRVVRVTAGRVTPAAPA